MLPRKSPACKVGPWLEDGSSDFGRVLYHSLIRLAHCFSTVCTMWFMLNICFPLECLEFWYRLPCREGLHDQPQHQQRLGHRVSEMNFPGRQHFTGVVTTHCCRNYGRLHNSPRRVLEGAHNWLPQTWPQEPFLFANFAVHPFTAINHSLSYMLSS